ncbi:MAG: hypothetical protein WEA61_07390 [Anaerolineales bacterium]
MPFEHHSQPILPWHGFFFRVLLYVGYGLVLLLIFLALGMLGYHFLVGLPWLDAALNASMILSGMGPVDPITTEAGKVFASIYALTSGIVFAVITGIVISPIVHRVFHQLHLKQPG